ncbi:hypothetical protein [Mycobacterium riyadhense]|uniref:Uncharacterized protein n=1 Tax=Mycobacterium riyadhense TaxID=486698 RepID=A0A1X2C5W0_9MYCO|nr:hypothetical protein [Mycobacterium riyadhense]ORW71282.1 hypothetical protein AWC22_25025 [Mycobacterium riyadhense]VTO96084.1 hypothetical protein BIN_B_01368 [Mycobacterium riyadhense]
MTDTLIVHSPTALDRMPHEVAAPVAHAYCDSLTQVFFCAGLIAVVGAPWRCFCETSNNLETQGGHPGRDSVCSRPFGG